MNFTLGAGLLISALGTEPTYETQLSHKHMFVRASHTPEQTVRIVGLHPGTIELSTLGFGARWNVLEVEAFYGRPKYTESHPERNTQHETVNTFLRNRHGEPQYGKFENTSIEYEANWGVRLGVDVPIWKSLSGQVSYLYFRPEEKIDAWNGESKEIGPNWWVSRDTANLSSVQATLRWTFGNTR